MKYEKETEAFINNYVKALKENNAVLFAGAGMSVPQGFFDWMNLLRPIADRLELEIEDEKHNLPALAQYFVDKQANVRHELTEILFDEYGKVCATSENHNILARLPIQIYWTTNYDTLIEDALKEANKTPDVKTMHPHFSLNKLKRDAIVYKMHGDVNAAHDTVLTKHEYEDFNKNRELFSNAFKSDFVARTFLFIGFGFTDPNLDFLISKIRTVQGENSKSSFYFIKKETLKKDLIRQQLKANSLVKYGLKPIWIDDFKEITEILREIEVRLLRSTILISGSAETYEPFKVDEAIDFIHDLSKEISKNNYKILTGFGLGVGSAVINGVLENMENQNTRNLDNYLIMRPFPQFQTKGKDKQALWTDYRKKFIPLAGIAIFIFGNKLNTKTGKIEIANGMLEEFEIAINNGLKVIPVGATGYIAKELWEKVMDGYETYYYDSPNVMNELKEIGTANELSKSLIQTIVKIINMLNR